MPASYEVLNKNVFEIDPIIHSKHLAKSVFSNSEMSSSTDYIRNNSIHQSTR